MKNTTLCIIIFSIIIIFSGLINSGVIENLVPTPGQIDIIDKIEIKWPSGKYQVLEDIKVNQILTIKEPL